MAPPNPRVDVLSVVLVEPASRHRCPLTAQSSEVHISGLLPQKLSPHYSQCHTHLLFTSIEFGISPTAGWHVSGSFITMALALPGSRRAIEYTNACELALSKCLEALDKVGQIGLVVPTSNHQRGLPGGAARGVGCMCQPHLYRGH